VGKSGPPLKAVVEQRLAAGPPGPRQSASVAQAFPTVPSYAVLDASGEVAAVLELWLLDPGGTWECSGDVEHAAAAATSAVTKKTRTRDARGLEGSIGVAHSTPRLERLANRAHVPQCAPVCTRDQ
jgi:hypothetical protein